ncbi:MAG: phosphatidate cytidylyltransferase [Spirochaetaceae bacterium]|nr:phosphatidate cytidylyltransferase [Spirochaetaceae bacterium]
MAAFYELKKLKTEIIRKSLHLLIVFVPLLASINYAVTVLLLVAGLIVYGLLESLRLSGRNILVFSALVERASRPRDRGHFVGGPVTLGLGALVVLLLYPQPVAASAIYALGFGDSFASIMGTRYGRRRPSFLLGKSVEGSLACFCAVFSTTYWVLNQGAPACAAAIMAMLVEALPLDDFDNIAIPVMVASTL